MKKSIKCIGVTQTNQCKTEITEDLDKVLVNRLTSLLIACKIIFRYPGYFDNISSFPKKEIVQKDNPQRH